ncbi:hypothetical protein SNE40_013915 [Patella caerulea]
MYGSEFAVLHDVIIDPFRAAGRPGGENMSSVWNQKESEEYFKLKKSYFRLNCRNLPHHPFKGRNHLNGWFKSVMCVADLNSTLANQINGITIAVQRYEYVNLYQTMADFYNVFLIMILFQIPPDTINILYTDGHPAGMLDDTWQRLFGKIYRAGHLANETKFAKMIWNIQSYNCPLQTCSLPYVPYLERFRDFFLFQHDVTNMKVLNCSKLSVTIIWRRDYVAHPRNPSGVIQRKIKNEDEFLESVTELLRGHEVKAVQLETIPMEKQLELVSETDILVGMHGAGLSHTLFLPKHGGLIELFPAYHNQGTSHFQALTRWRRLHYVSWKNEYRGNEYPNKKTYIPPTVAISKMKKMVEKLCPQTVGVRSLKHHKKFQS